MEVKKFVFCVLFFTNAINSAEEDNSDNKKISISTVEEDSSINKNNWNTKKWGSIFLLFKPISHLIAFIPERSWLTFFRIFTGDILYRYIAKKGVGVMVKLGFNSSFIFLKVTGRDKLIRLSPSLTLSFCWVYKKKGNKMFSGSICLIGVGWGNKQDNVQHTEEYKVEYKGGYKEEFMAKNKLNFSKESYFLLFLNINYLHYENGKGFFLSWGKFDMLFYPQKVVDGIFQNLLLSLWHLELGFSLLKSNHKKNIDL